jgi:adenylate cyclase
MSEIRRILPPLLLLLALLGLQVWDPGPVEAVRLKVFDTYQRTRPAPIPAGHTLIVDIDDRSLAAIGQWPWDRATVGRLIDRIASGHPDAIGLDIVFPEPDRLSPPRMVERLGRDGVETIGHKTLADTDRYLADIIASAPVVAAVAAAPLQGPNALPEPSIATLGGAPDFWLPRFAGAIANISVIAAHARGAGNITLEPGLDGIVRRIPMLTLAGNRLLPALSIEVLRVVAGESTLGIETKSWGVARIQAGSVDASTDGHGRIWLHYARHDPSRFIPAIDLLEGRVSPRVFAGRHILVGSSAFGLWDIRATPLGYSLPGVEIQAQTIDALESGNILHRPNFMLGLEILITAVAGLFLILTIGHIGASWTLLLHLLVVAVLGLVSWEAFVSHGWLIDASYPAIATTILYLAMVYAGHVRSESRRQGLTTAFKKYLSPVLVERLSHDGAKVDLGGELRETTILFADLNGFTTLSERLQREPQRLLRLINSLLDGMSQAVLDQDGTIDKFMGDNVMAFWNAPLDDPQHAAKACRSALAIQARIADLDQRFKADPTWQDIFDGSVHLGVGIGINTGDCVVGNLGSTHRFDYSAIGDAVNLASRLEGAAKRYRVAALVSQATSLRAQDGDERFAFLPLGHIHVRGRALGVDAYALIGGADRAAAPEFQALRRAHDAAMKASRCRAWPAFETAIQDCRRLAPDLEALYDALTHDCGPERAGADRR